MLILGLLAFTSFVENKLVLKCVCVCVCMWCWSLAPESQREKSMDFIMLLPPTWKCFTTFDIQSNQLVARQIVITDTYLWHLKGFSTFFIMLDIMVFLKILERQWYVVNFEDRLQLQICPLKKAFQGWHCGTTGRAAICIPHGCRIMSQLLYFWSSPLLIAWEKQCRMTQGFRPLSPMWEAWRKHSWL